MKKKRKEKCPRAATGKGLNNLKIFKEDIRKCKILRVQLNILKDSIRPVTLDKAKEN